MLVVENAEAPPIIICLFAAVPLKFINDSVPLHPPAVEVLDKKLVLSLIVSAPELRELSVFKVKLLEGNPMTEYAYPVVSYEEPLLVDVLKHKMRFALSGVTLLSATMYMKYVLDSPVNEIDADVLAVAVEIRSTVEETAAQLGALDPLLCNT